MLTAVQFVVVLAHCGSGWQTSVTSAEHSCHWNWVGVWLQFALNVTALPIVGLALLAETVHVGNAEAAPCQLSVTVAGALLPLPLVAMTP